MKQSHGNQAFVKDFLSNKWGKYGLFNMFEIMHS